MNIPKPVESIILEAFANPRRKAYGQVATIHKGYPSIRTVHIHYLPELGMMAFGTNTKSEKFLDLSTHPVLSGCYWDVETKTQYRFEGDVHLVDSESVGQESFIQKMWNHLRPEIRTAYLLDDQNLPMFAKEFSIDLQKPSLHFGVVLCKTHAWDVYEMGTTDYRFGLRRNYILQEDEWIETTLPIIHS